MKIKLINDSVYAVKRTEVTNGRLEIDFRDKTAEEIQDIFSDSPNLANILLLTDDGEKFGELPGWTVYGGVVLVGETKTVILAKQTDETVERLNNAEARAISADEASKKALEKAEANAAQVTDLQMALCEIYEGMGV